MRESLLLCAVVALLLADFHCQSNLQFCCRLGRELVTDSSDGEHGSVMETARKCLAPSVRRYLLLTNETTELPSLLCVVTAQACCLGELKRLICQWGASQAPQCESTALPELSLLMNQIRLECCLCCHQDWRISQLTLTSCSMLRRGCPTPRRNASLNVSLAPVGSERISTNLPGATKDRPGQSVSSRLQVEGADAGLRVQDSSSGAGVRLTTLPTPTRHGSVGHALLSDGARVTGASPHRTRRPVPGQIWGTARSGLAVDSTSTAPHPIRRVHNGTGQGEASTPASNRSRDSMPAPRETSKGPAIVCEHGRTWDRTLQVCVQTIISCPRGFILHPNKSSCLPVVQPDKPCPPGTSYDQFQDLCTDVDECLDQGRCSNKTEICRNTVGSFQCDCRKGFRHNKNMICEDIDECANLNLCSGEQKCKNTFGSYRCVRAIPCGFGWREDPDSNECVDIDECESYPGICGVGMKCVNIRGSHKCEDDECPPQMKRNNRGICSRCKDGFLYDNRTTACEDIDECAGRPDSDDGPCKDSEVCFNLPGSFECVPKKKCRYGTTLTKNGTACEDINECQLSRFRCQSDEICLNTYSSYQCVASPCAPSQQFDYALNKCVCRDGYHLTRDNICADIDECAEPGAEGLCGAPFLCVNHPGGYTCIHRDECPPGMYRASMYSSCQDVDECETGESKCPINMHCVNVVGSYRCMCNRGFVMIENNTCADVNECLLFRPEESCPDLEARCVNMAGGYKCQCPQGFQWSNYPIKKCLDINECERANPCGQMHECTNTIGSYKCKCRHGYRLAISGDSCEDIDECLLEVRKCVNGFCVNLPGGYACKCPPGFALDSKEICQDINECSSIDRVCGQDDQDQSPKMCINLLGYHKCVNSSCGRRYTRQETGNGFMCQLHKDSQCRLKDRACLLERPYRRVYEFIEISPRMPPRSMLSRVQIAHLPPGVLKSSLQLKYARHTHTGHSISVRNAFQLVTSLHDRDYIDLVLLHAIPAPAEVLLQLQVRKFHRDVFLGHTEAVLHLYFTRYPHTPH